MEILNDIILKNDDFSLKKGEAAFIFARQPQKGRVKYVSSNKSCFYYTKEPYFVKCVSYSTDKKDLLLINENIEVFTKWGVFQRRNRTGSISQKDIDIMEGGEIRLMNIILSRLKNENFIEINLVGLAFDSIERVLNYILYDISNNDVSYLIVRYTNTDFTTSNPIFLRNKNDIKVIINYLEEENRITRNLYDTKFEDF